MKGNHGIMMKSKVALSLAGLILLGCTSTPTTSTEKVGPQKKSLATIVYQSNRGSALEPCGCEYKPWGGIDREANAVEGYRKTQPHLWYVDAGNLYARTDTKVTHDYVVSKAAAITQMLNTMKLDLFAPGPLDYSMGMESLKQMAAKAQFKFISSNVLGKNGKSVFLPYHIEKRGELNFAFLSLSPDMTFKEEGYQVEAAEQTLARLLPELSVKADFVVLLTQLDNAQTQAIGEKYPEIRVIVGASTKVVTDKPYWFKTGKTLLVDPDNFGMVLGKLTIEYRTPFQGFYSPVAIMDNQDELKLLEAGLAKDPKKKESIEAIEKFKQYRLLAAMPGGSPYGGELIKLDKNRFGAKNAITQLIAKQKEDVRNQAIKH